jgi:uracil-DNA glycosylase
VYLLWGKKAHETAALVNSAKNLVIQEVHPSPLAGTGFVTSKCFSQCNKYLESNGKEKINWDLFNQK